MEKDSHQGRSADRGRRRLNIVTAVIWIAIIAGCIINRDRLTMDGVLSLTPSDPWPAAFAMLLLFGLKSLSFFIYSGMLFAVSGIMFSLPVAIAVNTLGTAIMVSIPYFLGRLQGSSAIERLSVRFPRLASVRALRARHDFMFTLIIRLLGLLPSDAVSLYCGADRVKYRYYLPACIIGFMPEIVAFAVLGVNANDPGSPGFLIALAANLVIMICSLVVVALMRHRGVKR